MAEQNPFLRLTLERFRCFYDKVDFTDPAHVNVVVGPNNSGKTTLIQALSTWHFALRKWKALKYREPEKAGESKEENGTVKSRPRVHRRDRAAAPPSVIGRASRLGEASFGVPRVVGDHGGRTPDEVIGVADARQLDVILVQCHHKR